MDLSTWGHVQMHDVKVRLRRDVGIIECVVKDGVTLTRDMNVASKLSCTIRRDAISPEKGDIIELLLDNKNMFTGVIITTQKQPDWEVVEAYDSLWYLARSTAGTYNYQNQTASTLARMIAGSLNLNNNRLVETDTGYKLPFHSEQNATYLDIIVNALEETKHATGIRWYIFDDNGALVIQETGWLSGQVNVHVFTSCIESYSFGEDLGKITTEVQVNYQGKQSGLPDGDDVTLTVVARNPDQWKRYGRLVDVETAQQGENPQQKANQLIKERSEDIRTLSVTGCQGDPNVRGGSPIWVDLFDREYQEYIRGWFRVDSVTHNFNGGFHTMDLETTLITMSSDWENIPGRYIDLPQV